MAAWVFYPVRSPPQAPGGGRHDPTPVGSVPRVRHSPPGVVGRSPRRGLRSGWRLARLKQAPLVVVLAGPSPLGPPCPTWLARSLAHSLTHSPDRCGEVMLPRAGPKPRQTRDGDVHGERGFSSRSACGPLASPLPPVGGGGKAGVRTPARPRSPVPCGVGGAGVLRRGRHSRLLACSASCLASGPPPRRGRAAPPPRHVPPRRGVSVSRLGPLRCPWSAPGCPSGARGRAAASLPVPSESSRVTPAVVVSPERLS